MKVCWTLIGVVSLGAFATAAEPLYAPPADYAYVQPGGPSLQPTPEAKFGSLPPIPMSQAIPSQPIPPQPIQPFVESYPPVIASLPVVTGQLVSLYPNVRVKNPNLAWPGGVSEVVEIPNPLPRSGNCDPVYVKICVPPGCLPQVTVGPRGQRITYAFGGYRVVVTALKGVVTVDYDRR